MDFRLRRILRCWPSEDDFLLLVWSMIEWHTCSMSSPFAGSTISRYFTLYRLYTSIPFPHRYFRKCVLIPLLDRVPDLLMHTYATVPDLTGNVWCCRMWNLRTSWLLDEKSLHYLYRYNNSASRSTLRSRWKFTRKYRSIMVCADIWKYFWWIHWGFSFIHPTK